MTVSTRLARRASALAATALAALTTAAVTAAPASAQPKQPAQSTTDVRLIAFNDLHGNLEPPSGSSGRVTLSDGSTVNAGGAAYLATHVKRLRAQAKNSVVLSTGDNVGASPTVSALFHDEPTIDLLNQLGVTASAVGNHELDEGYQELLRLQHGGCHPTDGCQFDDRYTGSRWPYLAANMTFDNGVPATLPFTITFSGGVPIGIIGVPLEELPTVVSADAIKGLKFGDEVAAINKYADLLDRVGVKSIAVLLHQGDNTEGGGPDDCRTTPGPATTIATQVSAKVDVVFSGHSHQQYVCTVTDPAGQPRPLIQGASFGRLLSVADLRIDRRTRDVVRSQTRAFNQIVTRDVPADKDAQALVDRAAAESAPIANRQVGTISGDVVKQGAASGESPLGDVIADSQLAATQQTAGAQLALMNPGGVRADLSYAGSAAGEGDGVVTYGEAYTVQPFGNILQTVTMTGDQLKTVLEQQWQRQPDGSVQTRILQPSASLHYTWSASAPIGSKVSDITVAGQPVSPTGSYRVTINNFLSGGGDGFTEFTKATNLTGSGIDLDAFLAYLGANPNLAPPALDRISTTA
ncbi:bifunctional metallophosphatase/5'-nucleotidase [Goodfellowiella coeruleoviolacea]|uniref:5'-nucleotidase n=1 Tax=Goodfellowiella coeruleoviolacea TaxID=334858 RepID=A0AAE3KDS5_9PSEU|nr:bifunctional metallophosphatase/5'-nucleotidase [Goodfellowiella coeruleoviolacea]MCP2164421.1 5'-nucleotidase [Goodfellowiella coeruleoviolacea]